MPKAKQQPRRTWKYTEEFKTKAVQLSLLEGVQVNKVAQTQLTAPLGLTCKSLRI